MVSTLAKILGVGALLIASATGLELVSRKPILLENVKYLGYRNEKSEGSQYPVFEVAGQFGPEKFALRDADPTFDCDDAYHKKRKHSDDGNFYNVVGYKGFFSGRVATNISPTNPTN